MKVSDYIVRFLEDKGIHDVFGIPGVGCGHFMNSMIGSSIRSHLVYHEQAAAFAANAYAQAARKAGFAYTTEQTSLQALPTPTAIPFRWSLWLVRRI